MPAIADLQPTTIPHALCTNNKPRCNTCSIYMHILTAKFEGMAFSYRKGVVHRYWRVSQPHVGAGHARDCCFIAAFKPSILIYIYAFLILISASLEPITMLKCLSLC